MWGKERGLDGARYPVMCHLLDTAAVARMVWRDVVAPGTQRWVAEQLGMSVEDAGRLVAFWAGLHDVGKLTPTFQRQVAIPDGYADAASDGDGRAHDQATHVWLASALAGLGYPSGRRSLARLVAELLGGHHGRFHRFEPRVLMPDALPLQGLGDGAWEQQRQAALAAAVSILRPPVPAASMRVSCAAVVSGVVILADWLASGTPYIKSRLAEVPQRGDGASLESFFAGSCAAAPELVRSSGLSRLNLQAGSFAEEFPDFEPNALQASIADRLGDIATGPGLLMVAAPTGFGKTEIALHAARRLSEIAGTSGLYVALPTMATADQMLRRVATYLARRGRDPAVTSLLHGMAWLMPVEATLAEVYQKAGISGDDQRWFSEWMRGAKRAMLAPVGVGTIDQALLSVLPTRHNALRMFALSGKTVIIDEVHAFSPYMRELLKTLLRWLGELRVPVVLLSATLPQGVARELAAAYLGPTTTAAPTDPVVPYPGWAYVQAEPPVAESARVTLPQTHRRTLTVSVQAIDRDSGGAPERMPALTTELEPLAERGGCAAVICTTVAETQRTYQALRQWSAHLPESQQPELVLLHSRFPAYRREDITAQVMRKFGKGDADDGVHPDRPARAILVASAIIEQSLDVDFDLVITDLAPIELLLQRAGRLQRHRQLDTSRPDWVCTAGTLDPRLVVLTMPERDVEAGRWPVTWPYIYPKATLIRAHRILNDRIGDGIRIPDDVQRLVDLGNPGDALPAHDPLLDGFDDTEVERIANTMVERQSAEVRSIPEPHRISSLGKLSEHEVDEEIVATRFNADSVRVLVCFETPDGQLRLGSPTGDGLPTPDPDGHFTRQQLATVMNHSIPVPGSLVRDAGEEYTLPSPWADNWALARLLLMRHRVTTNGEVLPAQLGQRVFDLDHELGLVTSTA
nr:CRISPR-associated helicase Cas3' [Haloechinothrix aidingensis]